MDPLYWKSPGIFLGMNRKDTIPKLFAAVLIGGIIIWSTYRGLSGV
jgi:hypothetical protein